MSRQVDGILLFPCRGSQRTIERLKAVGIPYVLMARYLKEGHERFFRFFLLCYQFIPVSLYVTLSCIYAVQGVLMENDLKICDCVRGLRHRYDEVDDEPMRVRTGNLNDDLGQVGYIFSDKTGTLTTNEMCVVTLLNLDKEGRAVAHAVEGISYNPDGHVEGVDRYDMSGRGVGA